MSLARILGLAALMGFVALWLQLPTGGPSAPPPKAAPVPMVEADPVRIGIECASYNRTGPGCFMWSVHVIALVDAVTVNDFAINRGNCGKGMMLSAPRLPAVLRFGERITLQGTTPPCTPIELWLDTDRGAITFGAHALGGGRL
jgi:hypothetical protein